jgi:uncharacterized protein Usg
VAAALAQNPRDFHFSTRNPRLDFFVEVVAKIQAHGTEEHEGDELGEPRRRERPMRDLELMIKDYRLTTAEILYHMPDHPSLLQTYIWQGLDIAPRFPVLHKFLDFWESSLDGRLHSVKVASAKIIKPNRFRYARALMRFH